MTPEAIVEDRPSLLTRITVSWKDGFWFFACSILAAGQLLGGVDPTFVGLVQAFIVMWLVAIRLCGGPGTLTGATVAYIGFQHVVFSQFAKLLLGQSPDKPLLDPIMTMEVYVLGMAGILAAAIVTLAPPFRKYRPILTADIPHDRLKTAAYVCTALMVIRYAGSPQLGAGGIRFLMNFEWIMPLSAAITAAWVVQESGGKKFLNWLSYINIGVPFLVAMIGFQRREAIFAGVIMIVTALFYGYRFQLKHYLSGLFIIYFFQFVYFPFALYYRNMPGKTNDVGQNLSRSWEALTTVLANPLEYQDEEKYAPHDFEWEAIRLQYYDRKPFPTFDRLSVIIVTDALLRSATQTAPTGWETISMGFDMWLPRAFNEDKRTLGTANLIARRAPGMVGPHDVGTQITMGYFAEAYMSFKWSGVFWIGFFTFFGGFLIIRHTTGDSLRNNFWASAMIVGTVWVSSEAPFSGLIVHFGQTFPLLTVAGLLITLMGNTFARGVNRQREKALESETEGPQTLPLAG